MDFPIARLTALPLFDDQFRKALIWLQLCTIERIIAFARCLPAFEAGTFAKHVSKIAPLRARRDPASGLPHVQDLETVAQRSEMFVMMFILIDAAKDTFLKEAAQARGFGIVDGAVIIPDAPAFNSPVLPK